MDWIVLSPFTRTEDPEWIFDFIDADEHVAKAVPATYHHDRSRRTSSLSNWTNFLLHGLLGFLKTFKRGRKVGVVTVFPQLAAIVALLKKLCGRKDLQLIAWCFNLGRPYGGLKGVLARFALSSVDIFVVHSRAEIAIYSEWLKLPKERFVFVHLSTQKPTGALWDESAEEPYVVALGTANRDYRLLTEAVGKLGYKTIIVAGKYAVEHIEAPPCVTFLSGLSLEDCHRLATRSRVNVVPIADIDAPSGQVTIIESMMLGVPLVATACAGTTDYIVDGVDGLLVRSKSLAEMMAALETLWNDGVKRRSFSAQAKLSSMSKFTFDAASGHLKMLMDQLERR